MAMISTTRRFKSAALLRKFGFTMAVPLAVIGGLLLWRKGLQPATYSVLGAALAFLVIAVVFPKLLGPIEWAWMKLAGVLSYVMTRVILTLMFFLAIAPLGIAMRLLRHDPLVLKRQPNATTYWQAVEPDGPSTRPQLPY